MICTNFQLSAIFSFPGKNSNIILRYRRFCEKMTLKNENVDIFAVKHIQSGLYNLILLHNSRLQLFGKLHGQSLSILDFIALKHLKNSHF